MRLTAAGIAPAFFALYFHPEISTKNIDSGLMAQSRRLLTNNFRYFGNTPPEKSITAPCRGMKISGV